MRVEHYIAKTLNDIFASFGFKPSGSAIKFIRCIAYEAVVDDETMAIYEMYEDKVPHFFGVYHLDHDTDDEGRISAIFKEWSRSTAIQLIEHSDNDFLFELTEPLGINFTNMKFHKNELTQEVKDIISGR